MTEQFPEELTILYVEDDQSAHEEMLAFLGRRPWKIFTALNGKEGLELYRTSRPDLIITDIRMPVMDGLEMVREIRALDTDVKIIVTSAHSDTPYLLSAIDSAIDAYVIKPVSSAKLLSAIAKCSEVITYRKSAARHQEEQRKSLEELQAALAKVKQLSGFLPICSSCKKIRDDQGYWQQIELYIRDHSEAEFSHGMCPECAKKIYGEYYHPDPD